MADAHQLQAWPDLCFVDPDQQEALVVAEGDIVTRSVFLDQASFGENRFGFVACHEEF